MTEPVCQQGAVEIALMHARRCRIERDAALEAQRAAEKALADANGRKRGAEQDYEAAIAALAKALDEETP